jgi:hypothetical protein
MPSEKVVVSAEEIDRIVPETDAPPTVPQVTAGVSLLFLRLGGHHIFEDRSAFHHKFDTAH